MINLKNQSMFSSEPFFFIFFEIACNKTFFQESIRADPPLDSHPVKPARSGATLLRAGPLSTKYAKKRDKYFTYSDF